MVHCHGTMVHGTIGVESIILYTISDLEFGHRIKGMTL